MMYLLFWFAKGIPPTHFHPVQRRQRRRSRLTARRAGAECRALGTRQGSAVAQRVASLEAPLGPLGALGVVAAI